MSQKLKSTICPICDGKGYELEIGEELCPDCAGIGRNNSELWDEPCGKCNNTRIVIYYRRVPCKHCNGQKVINY